MAVSVIESPARESIVVLCLNVGSSSLKVAVFRCGPHGEELLARRDEPIGERGLRRALDDALDALGIPTPDAIGHRVVHGGPHQSAPTLVTPALLDELRRLTPLAPLHQPAALLAIEVAARRYPGVAQVACFDTAFHRRMPELAQRFALPAPFWGEGVRRYGFHGLSYAYVIEELGSAVAGRIVVAHLGNGASMVALNDGEPRDTTMGLTPTGGLVMGTRTGDLDPGVLIYLAREHGLDADELETLIDTQSGLLGVSGITSDMRELLHIRSNDREAALAVDLFCYTARKEIGALTAVLGGIDTLVFTGGIGEHAAPVRAEICENLDHLGIQLDSAANDQHAAVISSADSDCIVRVLPTDEEQMIARSAARLLPSSNRR